MRYLIDLIRDSIGYPLCWVGSSLESLGNKIKSRKAFMEDLDALIAKIEKFDEDK